MLLPYEEVTEMYNLRKKEKAKEIKQNNKDDWIWKMKIEKNNGKCKQKRNLKK